MPQKQLPIFPEGVQYITPELAFEKKDGQVTYFNGHMPVFVHAEDDMQTFSMITAQFYVNGSAKQAEIARAFGVTLISLKRAVKRYRKHGAKGFFTERKSRGPAVLTAAVVAAGQVLLDEGLEVTEVAERIEVKRDTLAKAIKAGRLHKPLKKTVARKKPSP